MNSGIPLMLNARIFTKGALHGSPFLLVIAPFGLLFGVVATEAGLTIIETMAMTIFVIAGASQFTALALLSEHAPTLIIIVAALAVNLRMAMYSAALVPHFGNAPMRWRALAAYFMIDQTFAVAVKQYQSTPNWSVTEKLSYYFGSAAIICPVWYGSTFLGAVIGEAIPLFVFGGMLTFKVFFIVNEVHLHAGPGNRSHLDDEGLVYIVDHNVHAAEANDFVKLVPPLIDGAKARHEYTHFMSGIIYGFGYLEGSLGGDGVLNVG